MVLSLLLLNILYSSGCCKGISPFLLNLKPLFYSENQIRQTALTTTASVVVAAMAESTKLETIRGAQEEIATLHDQRHITQEKVMTPCRCAIHSCHVISKLPTCSSWVLLNSFSPRLFITRIENSLNISHKPFATSPAFTATFHS